MQSTTATWTANTQFAHIIRLIGKICDAIATQRFVVHEIALEICAVGGDAIAIPISMTIQKVAAKLKLESVSHCIQLPLYAVTLTPYTFRFRSRQHRSHLVNRWPIRRCTFDLYRNIAVRQSRVSVHF